MQEEYTFPLQWLDLSTPVNRTNHRSGQFESQEWKGQNIKEDKTKKAENESNSLSAFSL